MQPARHHPQPSAPRAAIHSHTRAGRLCLAEPLIMSPADGASLLATGATAGRFPIIRAFWRQPWLLLPALFLWTATASGQNVIAWGGDASGQTNIPASATNVIQVAAGGSHSLALRSDGSVVGWGAGVMVPASATNVVQIVAGASHSAALKADGRVVAWGSSIYGQSIVPASATNVIAIAAGNDHTLALRSNGTLVAWGNNNFGQTKIPTYCTNVSAIAAGGDLSLALCSDGVCVVWGRNGTRRAFRQPSDTVALSAGGWQMLALTTSGTLVSDGGSPPPAEATNVLVSATGTNYSLALRADGTVIGWGEGALTNVPPDAFEIVALSAGPSHCLAVKSLPLPPRILGPAAYRDGALFGQRLPLFTRAVGAMPLSYQWFANGDSIPGATSARPEFLADFATDGTAYQVVVSNPYGFITSAIFRVATRGLSVWGDDPYLQSRVPATAWYPRSVSAGEFHCLALTTNGTVKAWGKGFAGQTTVPSSATNVVAVAAGSDHSLALRADGSVVGWGSYASSQSKVPATVRGAVAISVGRAHSLALLTNGTLVAWGDDITGQRQIPLFARNTIAIASGYLHNMALQADGTVVTAGLDYPVPASATDVVAIAAGWEHCLALRGDGAVVAWGDDSFGQAQVPPSATNVVAIACGYYHNLAMRADGSLVAWGNGFRHATTMPPGAHALAAFAGGEHFTMALAPFGPPQCAPPVPSIRAREAGSAVLSGVVSGAQPLRLQWLRDGVEIPGATNQFLLLKHVTPSAAGSYVLFASNALGRATANPISLTVVPGTQPIGGTAQWRQAPYGRIYAASPSLPPVCSISSGGFHTLALHTDGTVVAWGKNRDGQCNVPITATAIVAVAAGGDHSLALREDGTVVAWGRNWDGQTSVPASASNVIAIAAGWAHSLALRSDGTVVAWGNNEYGQTDVSVIATDLKAISAGYYHSMGLRADGLVMTWGLDYPIPPEATNIVAIKAGWQHCLALRPDGSILAWGDNYHGHCNVPPSATNITAFASAYYCAVALRADGSLLSWGTNRFEYSGTPELSLPAVGLEAQEDTHAVLLSSGPPAFGHHFASVTVRLNGPLTLCPAVVGATDMQFQWLLNGQPVSGATGRCLTISRTAAADAGAYVLVA